MLMSWLCALPVIAGLLSDCQPPPPFATGYVEGDYVLVAPVEVARIERMELRRGDRVEAGQLVAELETRDAEIAVAEAEAALAEARNRLANLRQGRRPEEIAVLEASLASARATAEQAEREAKRLSDLNRRGIVPDAQADAARARADAARAKVAEIEANLAVARLPARPAEIAAAEAAVRRAEAVRDRARWRLEQRRITAPAAGRVFDVLREAGEIAGPSAPILSLLPDGAVRLKLWVPETEIGRVRIGRLLDVFCDACPPGLMARVSYVADGPEFTPPVIYSLENRQKLVYLVEARPLRPGELKPGQIVNVELGPADE